MSNNLAVLEVPLRAPISGPDGRVNPVWARWFLRVYAATGGSIGTTLPTEYALFAPSTEPAFFESQSSADLSPPQIEPQNSPELAPPIVIEQAQEMQSQIEYLLSYIATLETRISNLESGTTL